MRPSFTSGLCGVVLFRSSTIWSRKCTHKQCKQVMQAVHWKRSVVDSDRQCQLAVKDVNNVSGFAHDSEVIPNHVTHTKLEGCEVKDFSSQYGSEASLSYVAVNLAGQLNIFPKYGDYTQACVLRTYGPWWKKAPSATKMFRDTPSDFTSEDFIEIQFWEELYPVRIEIYETYNPGAVVRILACDGAAGTDIDKGNVSWATLWSGSKPSSTKQRPRIFAPPLKKINFSTSLIRIEFNSTCLDYYTELDGVKLVGTKGPPPDDIYINLPNLCFDDEDWGQDKKSGQRFRNGYVSNGNCSATVDYDPLTSRLGDLKLEDGQSSDLEDNFFADLPRELLQLILSYLNTRDRCMLGQTCRLLRDQCYDPLLYTDLNLQPFWSQISGPHLLYLLPRCDRLQRLNLSWLGAGGHISQELFKSFLDGIKNLKALELSCCKFVNSSILMAIVERCQNLTELNLSSCTNIDDFSVFNMYPLKDLKRLNLYRTKIDGNSLIALLKTSPCLEHLNFGSCVCTYTLSNLILFELGSCCKNLKSLDMWRIKNVHEDGLANIYNNCPLLEELDIGWSTSMNAETGCFINLAKKCPKIKKLFLTANRTVRDCDLKALADHCPSLQQLDILGTRSVTEEAILYVLEKCTDLMFLDVSFCVGITESNTCIWREAYPKVDIKKSFQDVNM